VKKDSRLHRRDDYQRERVPSLFRAIREEGKKRVKPTTKKGRTETVSVFGLRRAAERGRKEGGNFLVIDVSEKKGGEKEGLKAEVYPLYSKRGKKKERKATNTLM